MELHYTNNLDDLMAFNDHHYNNSTTMKRTIRLYRWGYTVFVFIVLMAYFYFRDPAANIVPKLVIATGAAIAVALSIPFFFRRNVHKYAKRLYSEGANKGLFGKHTLRIDSNGLTEISSVNESKTIWEGIERIESSANHTFIYIGAIQAHVIPHGAISDGSLPEFLQLLHSKLS